jgi:branched-chain amino acid transport system substrate-binding protein
MRRLWLAWMSVLLVAPGCGKDAVAPAGPGLPVGAVLPFTGDLGAVGSNLERALVLASERINAAGGVGGQPLRLAVRDDHSDITRGLSAAQALIQQENVVAIIGPEGENLAKLMVPLTESSNTILISPGVTSELTTTLVPKDLWFKVVPSATRFSRELAQRMFQDGIRAASIVYTADEYGTGFASVLVGEFKGLGGAIAALVPVLPEQRSFSDDLRKAVEPRPDGLVLVAGARTGAAIIQDWSIGRTIGRWYFSPPLKTELFVQNVPPGILDGMVGVAPKISGDATAFAAGFAARWQGDTPVTSAFFYYDALVLLGLASQAAATKTGHMPTALEVRDQLRAVSAPPGELVSWDNLPAAMEHVRAGREVDYQGISGSVDLGDKGEVSQGAIQFWTIRGDRIVDQ